MSIITEYDEARTMELFKKEALAEGRAEGRAELLRELVSEGLITPEKAKEKLKP